MAIYWRSRSFPVLAISKVPLLNVPQLWFVMVQELAKPSEGGIAKARVAAAIVEPWEFSGSEAIGK